MSGEISSLLGLGRRAGNIAVGDRRVREALREGRAGLVLLAGDAGEAVKRRFSELASRSSVPIRVWGRKDRLGEILGTGETAVLSVGRGPLAERLEKLLLERGGGAGEQ